MPRPHLASPALISVLMLALFPAPARAEDGAALQKALDANPSARADIETKARALGLDVLTVRAGPKGEERDELRVSGGAKPFSDCAPQDKCPAMVVVPASRPGFMIGSPPSEASPAHSEKQEAVSVRAFAAGQLEVTVAEYLYCVEKDGCRPPEWLEPGSQHNIETGTSSYYRNLGDAIRDGGRPIVGVSWTDAAAYASWLATLTGKPYRLLSEAEWEHAARAGTSSRYWWGDDISPGGKVMAACRGCGSDWDAKSLAPAAAFEPNAWGLFNVHGNVWEWVADFYCDTYASGPKDGSARSTDNCATRDGQGLRVLRGGSAFYEPQFARAATRLRNFESFRNFSVGFRVARTLDP